MEMWPWGLLAARVISLATGVRALVEVLSRLTGVIREGQVVRTGLELLQTFIGPVLGLVIAVLLWLWAGAIADAISLRVEDYRDESAPEKDEDDEEGSTLEPVQPDIQAVATVVFAAVGVFLIADGLPSFGYALAFLVRSVTSGEGLQTDGAVAPIYGALRIAVGWWIFANATRLYGLVPSKRATTTEPPADA